MDDIYYIIGTAYAGKSTMVKLLAEKYEGIACEENYHDRLVDEKLDKNEFPCLCYTRDLQDWREFIRRTPEEYASWIDGVAKECEILELQILKELKKQGHRMANTVILRDNGNFNGWDTPCGRLRRSLR